MYQKYVIIHISIYVFYYFQDQPESYPISVLRQKEPISFHRHFPDDPYNIYTSYLAVESTEDTDVQEPVEKQRRKCKSKETSTLMDLLEDEDLKKLLPPGNDSSPFCYSVYAHVGSSLIHIVLYTYIYMNIICWIYHALHRQTIWLL